MSPRGVETAAAGTDRTDVQIVGSVARGFIISFLHRPASLFYSSDLYSPCYRSCKSSSALRPCCERGS